MSDPELSILLKMAPWESDILLRTLRRSAVDAGLLARLSQQPRVRKDLERDGDFLTDLIMRLLWRREQAGYPTLD